MGLFDLFKQKKESKDQTPVAPAEVADQANIIAPSAIDPNALAEQKKTEDLAKLMQFENKIKSVDSKLTQQHNVIDETQQRTQIALKIRNPFRGY